MLYPIYQLTFYQGATIRIYVMHSLITRFIPKGSVVLFATMLGSYVMGLLRDRILAHSFGASTNLDIYNAAFLVPDFLFNVLVASGIAAAAVPLFTDLYKRNKTHAFQYMNSLIAVAVVMMIITAAVITLFAHSLSFIVAPGLNEGSRELAVHVMQILAFSPILFAISNALGALLIAQKRFLWYGLSPVFYNVGIISGALLLAPQFGIIGVAYGTVLGAGLHLLVRLGDALWTGWRPHLTWYWHAAEMKRTLQLMAPKMVGHPVELVTFWVFTSLASLLAPGSITVLNFSRNFQSVPVSLLGIAMATAVFPSLAQAATSSSTELRDLFRRTTLTILGASVAAALVVYIIRRPLVAILLGGGAFDGEAVTRTALTLGFFCLSIPTESLSHLFARAFYATKNTITPVIFSVISLVVAGSSAYVLSSRIGIIGLPLGFFFGSVTKTVGLWLLFLKRVDREVLTHY